MTVPAPQPPVLPFPDFDYSEVALETVAGLKKISKFATRLEDWFDLWSQSMLMPSLGVMQQAASLISRMTSIRKTLVHALNSLESPNPADNSPAPPSSTPLALDPDPDPDLDLDLALDLDLDPDLELDLDPDLNPDSDPVPAPAPLPISSLPSLPRLSIPAIASCPTIPLERIPAAAVALERKFRHLTASSFPDEESKRLSDAEAAELFEYLQNTHCGGRSQATFSTQEFPLKLPDFSYFGVFFSPRMGNVATGTASIASETRGLVSSSTKIASPPAPHPTPSHPPPGCYDG